MLLFFHTQLCVIIPFGVFLPSIDPDVLYVSCLNHDALIARLLHQSYGA